MQSDENQPASFADNWPSVLNRMLIGIGVLALGFLVADKALDSFKSQDDTTSAGSTLSEQSLEDVQNTGLSEGGDVTEVVVAEPQAPAPPPVVVERPQVVEVVVPLEDAQEETSVELVKEQESFVVTKVSDTADMQESVLEQLEHVFGSAVVIISATEPAYVETENERRFLIGSVLKNDRILSSISTAQLVVSRVGERQVYELPDLSVQ